jgi:hypothetical protein
MVPRNHLQSSAPTRCRLLLALLCVLTCALAVNASAMNILIDEDFEGVTPFVDQHFPIQARGGTMITTPTQAQVAVKGLNLLDYYYQDPTTATILTVNTGRVVTTQSFRGAQSLELNPGERVATELPAGVDQSGGCDFLQFALSASLESARLPAGTQVGHLKMFWSTTDTVTLSAVTELDFKVVGPGRIHIVCANTGSIVSEMRVVGGCVPVLSWQLMSIISDTRRPDAPDPTLDDLPWQAYDPLTGKYKGPVTGHEPASFPTLVGGQHIFCNSKVEGVTLQPDQVGPGWGDTSNLSSERRTGLLGWEIAAENGGTLYVDDIYLDVGRHADYMNGAYQHQAARMNEFDQRGNFLWADCDARDWQLYY